VLVARLDCEVCDEGNWCLFTWLSLPLVWRTGCASTHGWKKRWFKRRCMGSLTKIELLQIDIRYTCEEGRVWRRGGLLRWAVCAALKEVLGIGGESKEGEKGSRTVVDIDTLVLNVVKPAREDTDCGEETTQGIADELVDVWNELWAGQSGPQRVSYAALLQKIERVRVCVDGVLVKERELRLELERGQKEMKRIALRGGR
jgi:hypothetical protein